MVPECKAPAPGCPSWRALGWLSCRNALLRLPCSQMPGLGVPQLSGHRPVLGMLVPPYGKWPEKACVEAYQWDRI